MNTGVKRREKNKKLQNLNQLQDFIKTLNIYKYIKIRYWIYSIINNESKVSSIS